MLRKFGPFRLDPFEALLLAITAVVAFGAIGLFGTSVFGAETTPDVTVSINAAPDLVKPVVYSGVRVPKVKTSWFNWSDALTVDELTTLAAIYDRYESSEIPSEDIKRMSHLMRLLSSGAGSRDKDLETLFLLTVMQTPAAHPAKAFLEKKLRIDYVELKSGDKEYTDFMGRMEQTANNYGIPHSRWYP